MASHKSGRFSSSEISTVLAVIFSAVAISLVPVTFSSASTTSHAKEYRIGSSFRDGQFRVTIRSSRCGISRVGTGSATVVAKGQFCAVSILLRNVSRTPALYDCRSDLGFDSHGRQFGWNSDDLSADNFGNSYSNGSIGMSEQTINPTYALAGNLYLEIPKKDKLVSLDLYTNSLAQLNGVKVSLTAV